MKALKWKNEERKLSDLIPWAKVAYFCKVLQDEAVLADFYRVVVHTILSADWDFTKLTNFYLCPEVAAYKDWKKGNVNKYTGKYTKYIKNNGTIAQPFTANT